MIRSRLLSQEPRAVLGRIVTKRRQTAENYARARANVHIGRHMNIFIAV